MTIAKSKPANVFPFFQKILSKSVQPCIRQSVASGIAVVCPGSRLLDMAGLAPSPMASGLLEL